jgi:hypothetical protein
MRTTVVRRSVVLVGLCALAIVLAFSSTSAAQMTPYQTMVEYTGPGEHPVSVVVDKVGNVWVSLQPICQVRKYAPNWREVARIDLVGDCSGGTGSTGLAVDATGRLYAAVKGPVRGRKSPFRARRQDQGKQISSPTRSRSTTITGRCTSPWSAVRCGASRGAGRPRCGPGRSRASLFGPAGRERHRVDQERSSSR